VLGSRAFLDAIYPDPVPLDALTRIGARGLAGFLVTGRYEAARLLEARRSADGTGELLILDLTVPLGQRKRANDIQAIEPIAIAYESDARTPAVYPLRAGFPDDVPHFNITRADLPRSLCLFDLAQDEILRILTPFILLERTRHWMVETAYGRLHGEDQPLDPLFGASGQPVVLPPMRLRSGAALVALLRSDKPGAPLILREASEARNVDPAKVMAALVVTSPALPHGRLRAVPGTMAELLTVFEELKADVAPLLRDPLRAWAADATNHPLYDRNLLLVVATPIERQAGVAETMSVKAFYGDFTAGDLAEALGAVIRAGGQIAPPLGAGTVDTARLATMGLAPMDVHQPFDRALAQRASGMKAVAAQPIALVGAGALGSQIAITAAREGLGAWTIYDDDHLMPHNLARHALSPIGAGAPKAMALTFEINALLDDPKAAVGLVGDVRKASTEGLTDAELVIDASASVPVARWLANHAPHTARSASTFFNPRGDELVVLVESHERAIRLDALEMSYYWRLASTPHLLRHLHDGSGILPAGGCRSMSLQVPQSRVAIFAGLAVRTLLERPLADEGLIEIWRLGAEGVAVDRWPADAYLRIEVEGWTVMIREAVIREIEAARAAANGLETGGILVGSWDRRERRAYIVGHFDPPPDSEHSATGFVRGMVGVYQTVEQVEDATALNLTYVGEWHTHPPRHSSQPSQDDANLLKWIGGVVSFSDAPPLMVIAGDDGVRTILGKITSSAIARGN
jgi:hypothetical protein